MSKPFYWIVWVNGTGDPRRFQQRATMRAFVALQKLQGHSVIIKSVGF